jgi:hypothetical protein
MELTKVLYQEHLEEQLRAEAKRAGLSFYEYLEILESECQEEETADQLEHLQINLAY